MAIYLDSHRGSDVNPGTREAPLRTFDALPELAGPQTVYVRGRFARRRGLALGARFAGWTFVGEGAEVLGSVPLTEARREGERLVFDISEVEPEWPSYLRRGYNRLESRHPEVFYRDKPLRLATWPKMRHSDSDFVPVRLAGPGHIKHPGWTITDLNLEGLQPIEGRAFWSGMPDPTRKYLWTAFGDVREVDFDAGSVTLQAGQSHPVHDEHKGEWSEAPEISIHSLDQLTDPGEFWIEAETALAYLILPGPHDPEETRISVCDAPLVTLEGDGITWRGIDVKQGRGDGLVVNGANCRVEECRLNNHKREGLRVHGVRVRVTGCEITGNGYRGARCNSGPGGNNTDPGDRGNCVLQRNEIHANGRLMARNPQLAIYGSGHIVRDNDIHTGGAALVKLGGYFVTLENNRLIDGCLWCADYGAVYGMDTDPNKTPEAELKNRRYAVIRGNRFENIRRTVPNFYTNQAIYLDHQYTGAYIENNTFVRVQVPWRTYGSMVIRGNHCIDCLLPGGSYNRLGEHMEFVFEDNTWEGPDPVYDYATMGQGTSGLRIKGSIHRAAEDVPIETVRD